MLLPESEDIMGLLLIIMQTSLILKVLSEFSAECWFCGLAAWFVFFDYDLLTVWS